jgi:hypothetical protein
VRWDTVLRALIVTVEADPLLAGIYSVGGVLQFRKIGTGQRVVPSLEYMLIGDSETELWAPCTVQFDQWVKTSEDLRASERRLRGYFHLDVPGPIGGIGMFAQYLDGDDKPMPDREGVFGRSIRFRFTPLRERYDSATV